MKKIGAGLLSLLLLIACVLPASAEMSGKPARTSREEPTLENMMDAWERRDMEQLHTYYEALYTPLAYDEPEGQPTITPYWQTDTTNKDETKMCHQKLTIYGFLLYLNDMQIFFGKPLDHLGFTLDDLSTLMKYSEIPDLEEMGFAFAGHFYDPDTGKSWTGLTNPTAKTQTSLHYNRAISYYNTGFRTLGLQELGMALHYLQDINEPHHASNKVAGFTNHSKFEAFASTKIDAIVEALESTGDLDFYQKHLNRPVADIAHDSAVFAKQFVTLATDDSSNMESRWTLAAIFTIGGSISSTSELLYRFARDVHIL